MLNHGVTFNLGSAKVCSPAIFETCFSYHKHRWIAVTYYYIYFYLIVLVPLTAILKFYKLVVFSLLINVVMVSKIV